MRDDLRESFKCDVGKYFRDMTTISKGQTKEYRKRLVENGYAIVEARTSEVGWLSYAPTKKLFTDIIDKYNTDSIFESMKCFNELADLHECSMGACGSKFNLYCHARNFEYDFSYTIDFEKHRTEWKFTRNKELPPYDDVCKAAWESLRRIPYKESSIKEFERICNAMFDYPIFLEFKEWRNDEMIVDFEYSLANGKKVKEFYDVCELIMVDTLCYEDEAKEFLERYNMTW